MSIAKLRATPETSVHSDFKRDGRKSHSLVGQTENACKLNTDKLDAPERPQQRGSPQHQSKSATAKSELLVSQVLVVGTGPIGGALLRRIKLKLPDTKVTACDLIERLSRVSEDGLADAVTDNPVAALPAASLVLLCAPPEENVNLLCRLLGHRDYDWFRTHTLGLVSANPCCDQPIIFPVSEY